MVLEKASPLLNCDAEGFKEAGRLHPNQDDIPLCMSWGWTKVTFGNNRSDELWETAVPYSGNLDGDNGLCMRSQVQGSPLPDGRQAGFRVMLF